MTQVADAWVTLVVIAAATEQLRLGPMIVPVPRRRPARLPGRPRRSTGSSNGRLVLGVGIGSDRFGRELSATGEQLDDRLRGQMLDESLQIATAAWSAEPVHHRGQHDTIDGVQFLPAAGAASRRASVGCGVCGKRQAAAPGGRRTAACALVEDPRWEHDEAVTTALPWLTRVRERRLRTAVCATTRRSRRRSVRCAGPAVARHARRDVPLPWRGGR